MRERFRRRFLNMLVLPIMYVLTQTSCRVMRVGWLIAIELQIPGGL